MKLKRNSAVVRHTPVASQTTKLSRKWWAILIFVLTTVLMQWEGRMYRPCKTIMLSLATFFHEWLMWRWSKLMLKFCLCAWLHFSIFMQYQRHVRKVLLKSTTTGTFVDNQRGQHEPRNKTTPEHHQAVKAHIQFLSTCTSHYSWAKSHDRKYLPPGS